METAGVLKTLANMMNIYISVLFLLLMPTAVFAGEEALPRFHRLAEFLAWADRKLGADDYDALVKVQAHTKSPEPTQLANVKGLDAQLGESTLTKIYAGREFPKDAITYKLGGHMKELGHFHIDFAKDGDSWRVAQIWQCR